MTTDNATVPSERPEESLASAPVSLVFALVIVWSEKESARMGEVALLEGDGPWSVGRDPRGDDARRALRFMRQRPELSFDTGALADESVSRRQFDLRIIDGGIEIENIGRVTLLLNGVRTNRGYVRPGDVIELVGHYLFYFTERPRVLSFASRVGELAEVEFGEADAHGFLGETPAMWALRDQIAFAAESGRHVLVLGASGTGKELAAQAIHAQSPRRGRALVAKNAATFAPGLVDAELFGSPKNFPNAGSPERAG